MESVVKMDLSFYKGKTVLVTGHTGFKGSWMCTLLKMKGAKVIGYSLEPTDKTNLFEIADVADGMVSIIGDIRDLKKLNAVVDEYQPEIVIHMAAQPIVRESYTNPVYTYETNVIGTVNIMEAIRLHECVRSFVNVTTDKVYKNNEWEWGYRESDVLDGYDPYSNSKSCSELVTASYKRSFFEARQTVISTCRAGNVIGGGDFSKDRIIPDSVRAMERGEKIMVRNPYSVRPYQHVLEPVFAYLKLAELQYKDKEQYEGNYNIGPNDEDCVTTGELVDLFCHFWGEEAGWTDLSEKNAPHEAGFLKLDCSHIKKVMRWEPVWHVGRAVEKTVEWYKGYLEKADIKKIMRDQIVEYEKEMLGEEN